MAMMNQSIPVLLTIGGNYAKSKELQLEDVLSFAFPCGMVGSEVCRAESNIRITMSPEIFLTFNASIYDRRCLFGSSPDVWSNPLLPKWSNGLPISGQ